LRSDRSTRNHAANNASLLDATPRAAGANGRKKKIPKDFAEHQYVTVPAVH
jgi:hypothetical protein